jgi:hypothetical protein
MEKINEESGEDPGDKHKQIFASAKNLVGTRKKVILPGSVEMEEGNKDLFKDMELNMEDYNFFEEDDEEIYGMKMDKASKRQIRILKWVSASPLAEPIQGGSRGDFFIRPGHPVRLEDGLVVEAVAWLEHEGFDEFLLVKGYTVIRDQVDGADGECLIFRKREIVQAPFRYKEKFLKEDTFDTPPDMEDDIPF